MRTSLLLVVSVLALHGCKKEEAKPAEAKPAEAKPAEVKPAEVKPAEPAAAEAKPAEPAAEKPAEKAAEKPAEAAAAPAEEKPFEGRLEKTAKGTVRVIDLAVTEDGYVPGLLAVKKGEPVRLVVTRKTDETCATDLLIEGTKIKVKLPLNKPVTVNWTPTKSGKVKYGCAMNMMVSGMLLVE